METIGKGGIFASYKTFPYYPQGCLIGQLLDESCVAAVCRMILQDDGIEIPEAYLRNILQTDEQGTLLSNIAPILQKMRAKRIYELKMLENIEKLREKVDLGATIVAVKIDENNDFHTIIVDKISDEFLSVRDPLPNGTGKAYQLRIEDFLSAWFQEKLGKGLAIVVK